MALISGNATYMLLNAASRTMLDLTAGNRTSGTSVIGFDAHINDGNQVGLNQQWQATQLADIAPDGTPYYSLRNVMGTTYLTMDSNTTGIQVVCRSQNSTSDGQKWHFSPLPRTPSGSAQVNAYTVCNKFGKLCLDIDGANRTNGAPVIGVPSASTPPSTEVWMLVVLQ